MRQQESVSGYVPSPAQLEHVALLVSQNTDVITVLLHSAEVAIALTYTTWLLQGEGRQQPELSKFLTLPTPSGPSSRGGQRHRTPKLPPAAAGAPAAGSGLAGLPRRDQARAWDQFWSQRNGTGCTVSGGGQLGGCSTPSRVPRQPLPHFFLACAGGGQPHGAPQG